MKESLRKKISRKNVYKELKSNFFLPLTFFSANHNGAANKVQGNNASGKKVREKYCNAHTHTENADF